MDWSNAIIGVIFWGGLAFALIGYVRSSVKKPKPTRAELAFEKRQQYQRYLASAHWRVTRDAAVERAGGRCERCGSRDRLEVHHKTYKHLYDERPDELEVLCHVCHDSEHFGGL